MYIESFCRDDDGLKYVLIGVVSGNPAGCDGAYKKYPDYFTFLGHESVRISITFSSDQFLSFFFNVCINCFIDIAMDSGNNVLFS